MLLLQYMIVCKTFPTGATGRYSHGLKEEVLTPIQTGLISLVEARERAAELQNKLNQRGRVLRTTLCCSVCQCHQM